MSTETDCGGKPTGYYNMPAASYGLQVAAAQVA
jgi:hypothetical protein